jgi:hypothetical protein
MADNVSFTYGDVAADDISGVLYQRVKPSFGVDGTATDVSATDPLPVVQTGTPALPTGAATAANQSTGNTSLASILAKLSADPATQTTLASILTALAGTLTVGLPSGASTAANQSSELTLVGAVAETAPASDTASSGLNGRLQRIAQRVSSLIALLPTALGGAGGLKVEQVAALPSGTNNIGDVDVLTLPALPVGTNNIGDVDVLTLPALPAGTNNIGDVDVLTLPALPAGTNMFGHVGGTEYETVAASQTDQSLGATGATGDYLSGVLVIPATTSPGAVAIKDGAGSAITVFTGGATSVGSLVPFFVPIGAKSGAGAWKVTTGTNVSAIGVGDFT